MARFRLTDKHYLNTDPPTEWEQKETDQTTGRQLKKVWNVPRYLDPEDKADWNYDSSVIVATKFDPQYPKDIIFHGPPTGDMEPLDGEARALKEKIHYVDPINSLPSSMEADFDAISRTERRRI